MALGFLPLRFVPGVFNILCNSGLVRQKIAQYPSLQAFLDYVRNTYISPNSTSPPHRWNLFHRNMDTRTNNVVESFHKQLNSAISVRHPSLWIFTRHLKDFHAESETKIQNANAGAPRPNRRRKWRRVESRLLNLKTQYVNGRRNLHSYWSATTYYVKEFLRR